MISPSLSVSMPIAREALGSPGISIMAPEVTTRKPAPADSSTSETRSFQPVGAPIRFGSSESEYCVLAMHTGRWPKPQRS